MNPALVLTVDSGYREPAIDSDDLAARFVFFFTTELPGEYSGSSDRSELALHSRRDTRHLRYPLHPIRFRQIQNGFNRNLPTEPVDLSLAILESPKSALIHSN